MPYEIVGLETLPERILKQFAAAMEQAAGDCADRPLLEAARKVTLQVIIKPKVSAGVPIDANTLPTVSFAADVRVTIPAFTSREYEGDVARKVGSDGKVTFAIGYNAASPADVKQGTFDQVGDRPPPREVTVDPATGEVIATDGRAGPVGQNFRIRNGTE